MSVNDELMHGTCGECRHWDRIVLIRDNEQVEYVRRPVGVCVLIQGNPPRSKEAGIAADCEAELHTAPTFGCALWQRREDGGT